MGCAIPMIGSEFSDTDIEAAARSGRLLSMEIEFSLSCNFRCRYCYNELHGVQENELSPDEIRGAILQAKELGARKIIVLGGEPMIYPHIEEMITFIRSNGMTVEIFTNGTNITPDRARFLFRQGIQVILKMNSLTAATQDDLAGKTGAHSIIMTAFENLRKAGYPGSGKVLGISTVICRQNIAELPAIWEKFRKEDIIPYFEMITPQGTFHKQNGMDVSPDEARELFGRIAEIDERVFGLKWEPQPPLVGSRCLRHMFSCVVNSFGFVLPCVGVTIPVGNIRERKLSEIIVDSEIIRDLRNYRQMIRTPCGNCDKAETCYGCRGAAYQMTGDYLAADPLCWKNTSKGAEITKLPSPINGMIPHRTPMRIVDTIASVGERTAVVQSTINTDSPFVGADGVLDDAAYIELMAQSIAALNGFRSSRNNSAPQGLLLGAKNVEILGHAHVGDTLSIRVFKETKYGGFGIVKGSVSRNGDILARGEIKVWHVPDGAKASESTRVSARTVAGE